MEGPQGVDEGSDGSALVIRVDVGSNKGIWIARTSVCFAKFEAFIAEPGVSLEDQLDVTSLKKFLKR